MSWSPYLNRLVSIWEKASNDVALHDAAYGFLLHRSNDCSWSERVSLEFANAEPSVVVLRPPCVAALGILRGRSLCAILARPLLSLSAISSMSCYPTRTIVGGCHPHEDWLDIAAQ